MDKFYVAFVTRTVEVDGKEVDEWRVLAIRTWLETPEQVVDRYLNVRNYNRRSIDPKWELWSIVDMADRTALKADSPIQIASFHYGV